MDWPTAPPLTSARLLLEPLTVEHAGEMVGVLAPLSLYEYIGGRPPTTEQLTRRYGRQAAGRSPDGAQGWLNWVIRRRDTNAAIGYTQATLEQLGPVVAADIAWVVTPSQQGSGFATEAATAMCEWLRQQGVAQLIAYINPENLASATVAHKLGMRATDTVVDGETRWRA